MVFVSIWSIKLLYSTTSSFPRFIEPLSRFPQGGPLPVITGVTTTVSRAYNLISDWYCWWLKSCTTKDDDYPIIYRVLTIPGGAGTQPSTVGAHPDDNVRVCITGPDPQKNITGNRHVWRIFSHYRFCINLCSLRISRDLKSLVVWRSQTLAKKNIQTPLFGRVQWFLGCGMTLDLPDLPGFWNLV